MVEDTDLNHARELYQKISHHEPFEDVAKRFSLPDLEYLLKGADRLKLTYIYNSRYEEFTCFHDEELRRWINAGIPAREAKEAKEAGYTADTLQEAIKRAQQIDGSVAREGARQMLMTHAPAEHLLEYLQYLQGCIGAGLNQEWVREGLAEQASVEVLQELQAAGVPPRYIPCAVHMAKIEGTIDYKDFRRWYLEGVSPGAAMVFIEACVGAETAISWLDAGFLPAEAIAQIQTGISPQSVELQTAKSPFSKAFRRTDGRHYSISKEFKDRVREAVDALDVPSSQSSGMFTSLYSTGTAFLDGGYAEERSHYGSYRSKSDSCDLTNCRGRIIKWKWKLFGLNLCGR